MSDQHYSPTEADLVVNGEVQSAWHERAAAVTRRVFGRAVFVRAVVEVSNFCRENCCYCGMRRDNRSLIRYRAQLDQLAELLIHHRPRCITDVNLQAGEDPKVVREIVAPLIRTLRRETPLGVSVCLGTLSAEDYRQLREAGASIYIMKFECADAAEYGAYQAPGTLEERLAHIRLLAETGWSVSSGFIAGLPGQTPATLLQNIELAVSLPLRGCSVSPFIPGEATPLANSPIAKSAWALNSMAALRLMKPDWVIPAVSALNMADSSGYRRGLRTGANLVTINLTPDEMKGDYLIYKRDRFIMTEGFVLDALGAEGLSPSTRSLESHYRNGAAHPAAQSIGTIPV